MRIFENHRFVFHTFCGRGPRRYAVLKSTSNPCIYVVMHPDCSTSIAAVLNRPVYFREIGQLCEKFVVRGFVFPEGECPDEIVMEDICSRPFI